MSILPSVRVGLDGLVSVLGLVCWTWLTGLFFGSVSLLLWACAHWFVCWTLLAYQVGAYAHSFNFTLLIRVRFGLPGSELGLVSLCYGLSPEF